MLTIALILAAAPMGSPPPDATATTRGLVNTTTQTFGGLKTFTDGGIVTDIRPGSSIMGTTLCSSTPTPGQSMVFNGNSWCPTIAGPQPSFVLAPPNGVGMGSACACTTVTSTSGVPVVGKRQGPADCVKSADPNNIRPGDLVTCQDSQLIVTPGFNQGTALGIQAWAKFVSDAWPSDDLDAAQWTASNVTVTANTDVAPTADLTADTLNDASGAALGCVTQTITTSSQTKHAVSWYVKGKSSTKATLKMTGTGNSAGDCTATSTTLTTSAYQWLSCLSPTVYGAGLTAVTISLCVGTAAADTGTVVGFRANHATNVTEVPPSIQTLTGAVTRYADLPYARYTPTGISSGLVSFDVITSFQSTNNVGLISLEAGNQFKQSVISLPAGTPNAYVGGSNKTSGSISAAGLYTVRLGWSGSSTTLYVNGTTTTGAAGTPTGTDFVRIGNYSDTDTNVQSGVYKNIVVATGNTDVRVGWPGDSISEFVPGYWMTATGKFAANWSVSGSVIAQCIQQWRTYRTASEPRVFFWCGVNDVLNGQTGANTWAAYLAAVQEIQATGAEVIMANIMPFGTYVGYTAGKDTERLSFNSSMASWCSSHPTQKCVDLASQMWDPANHTNLNPTYSLDGLHPNAAGRSAAAGFIAAVLF